MRLHRIDARRSVEVKVHRRGDLSLPEEAAVLRRSIVTALHHSGGGHYGGSLSVLDLLLTLYRRELRVAPGVLQHPDRDRLILSKGHAAVALYAILQRLGYFEHSLDEYASFASPLEGHPDMVRLPELDFSTGALGQGLSVGIGMALALRSQGRHVWVVLGDGECQEGQIWEAAMLAAQCGLGNLHAVVDYNRFQEWGWNRSATGAIPPPIDGLSQKWAAFGWNVLTADGHHFEELETAFATARLTEERPSVVIAHTVKGKGFPFIESDPLRFHCGTLTDAEHAALMSVAELAS
jgi:transketolase